MRLLRNKEIIYHFLRPHQGPGACSHGQGKKESIFDFLKRIHPSPSDYWLAFHCIKLEECRLAIDTVGLWAWASPQMETVAKALMRRPGCRLMHAAQPGECVGAGGLGELCRRQPHEALCVFVGWQDPATSGASSKQRVRFPSIPNIKPQFGTARVAEHACYSFPPFCKSNSDSND